MFLIVSCTIGGMTEDNRKRLAAAVIARRVQLGMRTTTALAEAVGLSTRMLGDVENGRRENFSAGAKAQIERALKWAPKSIDDVLSGKEPTPAERTGEKSPWVVDHSADLSSAGLLHVLTLLWETWRDLAMELAPSLNPEMNRRLRRAMLLTANATLDILELAAPIQGVDELTADITNTATELLGNRPAVTPPVQDDHDRDSPGTVTAVSASDAGHVWKGQPPDKAAPRKRG